jgi:hypothetical protein
MSLIYAPILLARRIVLLGAGSQTDYAFLVLTRRIVVRIAYLTAASHSSRSSFSGCSYFLAVLAFLSFWLCIAPAFRSFSLSDFPPILVIRVILTYILMTL